MAKEETKRETSSLTHRLALDGLSEELAGGDEDGADDEHGDGPFVVQLEGQVVDRDLAHPKEDLSRSLSTCRGVKCTVTLSGTIVKNV